MKSCSTCTFHEDAEPPFAGRCHGGSHGPVWDKHTEGCYGHKEREGSDMTNTTTAEEARAKKPKFVTVKGNSMLTTMLPKMLHIVWDEVAGIDVCYTTQDSMSMLIVEGLNYALENGWNPSVPVYDAYITPDKKRPRSNRDGAGLGVRFYGGSGK